MTLTCELAATAAAGGIILLEFTVTNHGDADAELSYGDPFTRFALRAWVGGEEVSVAIPPTSIQVREVTTRLASGEALTLGTPIHLRFDRDALYGAGRDRFSWALVSDPGPVELEAVLTLGDVTVGPCRAVPTS